MRQNYLFLIGWICLLFLYSLQVYAQKNKNQTTPSTTLLYDTSHYNALKYRNIGPFRGGRSCAITGVSDKPNLYYFGSTGGGVWRTTDAGASWENISDGFFGGSIGAVAVSESDNNIIYVGEGEKTVRGNVSEGFGMWKSDDAGKTWKHIGLKDSRHISRIRIHPKNPDLVYVAAMGHLFGPNEERGVYRSKDGGKTWERILFANNQAGAVDLVMDPNNPRVLYASTWRVIRKPYTMESGGEGSALWKSTDGGDTWVELTKKSKGLPKGTLGIIGVTASAAKSDRIWAIIEAQEGGVFRSDDGGETWVKVNDERKLRQRAWYYTRIYADTQNPDIVYVVNVQFWRSKDGGRTYENIPSKHGDHHDLWINSKNNQYLALADDGGAVVSLNFGQSWSSQNNQPTAQMYRVALDNDFPYRLLGGQQDNSALRIRSRSDDFGITERDWESSAGGESAHMAADPKNPNIVYGGSYGGYFTRFDHSSNQERSVDVYPDNPMGYGAKDFKYRFQWNFPLSFSPHDPNTIYAGSNILFKSTNEGQSWTAISPDLTRNDTTRMQPSGGPITKDNTGVEYYCTIFAFAESPYEKDLIWVGSDDGLLHVTRDGGKNWENVTPKGMPEWVMINSVEPHPFIKGGCYVAGTRYKSDDFQPYLYKTTDYGKTWTKITNGIPNLHFTRVLRADPKKQGLLYAGTEYGMYISFDDGANWQSFQLNLPIVPITDLAIKDNDLTVATQGRSYWILDDLTLLHQLTPQNKTAVWSLFKPRPTYNTLGGGFTFELPRGLALGQNPPGGVMVHFNVKDKVDTTQVATLEFLDKNDKLIRKFSTKVDRKKNPNIGEFKIKQGSNRFVWNMRYDDADRFDNLILWAGGTQGPKVAPGTYKVKLTMGKESQTQEFEIIKDPRLTASQSDLEAQTNFLLEIRDKLTETHKAIKQIRKAKTEINGFTQKLDAEKYKPLIDSAKALTKRLTAIEETLYQTKNQSGQDPLNYPIRLNNKLSSVGSSASSGYYKPTDGMIEVKRNITTLIDKELAKLRNIITNEVPKFNQMVMQQSIPLINVDEEKKQ